MTQSLSVLFPVRNAQHGLENQVERVLDILPELADRFDVLIIDDGSTDDTADVARDLARRYPQVEVVRHSTRRGVDQAIETGLGRASSDVVFVHASDDLLDAAKLAELWSSTSGKATSARSGGTTIMHTDGRRHLRRSEPLAPRRTHVIA